MADTDTGDTETSTPTTRTVILARDRQGEPTWSVEAVEPSGDLLALLLGDLTAMDANDPEEVVATIRRVLKLFVRPLVIGAKDQQDVSDELYRRAMDGRDWLGWILSAIAYGDFEARELTNRADRREGARAKRKGRGRGGQRRR